MDLAAFVVILTWAITSESPPLRDGVVVGRVVALCILPGLFVALLLGGYPLAHMKRGDLYYGAQSLGEMTRSLVDASLYQLNPRFGGSLFKVMRFLKPLMLPALGILCVCRIIVTRRLGKFAAGLAGIVTLAVLMHWAAFRFDGCLCR